MYVFASTQSSESHVSGWNTLDNVCRKIVLKNRALITATKNRHRISTLYASLGLPEKDREYFYNHMGHSKEINENQYQAPAAIMEITKVGKNLMKFDKGIYYSPLVFSCCYLFYFIFISKF